jgi:hypothetical protein
MRRIYVENRLWNEIQNPDPADDYRIGKLWSDLDHFSLEGQITVGYGPEPTCRMKRLDPSPDEVWEIRSKDPEPQVRVFGRFSGPDRFVATNAAYRDYLGDPGFGKFAGNHWPQEIQRCHTVWNQLFQGSAPHSGQSINDYITANVVEVGRIA